VSFSEPNNISNECLINKIQFGGVFNTLNQITFSKIKFKVITENLYVNKLGQNFKFTYEIHCTTILGEVCALGAITLLRIIMYIK